jgi:hypothetical protein
MEGKPLNRDIYAMTVGKLPKPQWFDCYSNLGVYNFSKKKHYDTSRWCLNLRRLQPEVFSAMYQRYLRTGDTTDVTKPE